MIPTDWTHRDSVKVNLYSHPNSWGTEVTGPKPVDRGVSEVRVDAAALILGQMWKENFSIDHPIFKKRGIPTQNNN